MDGIFNINKSIGMTSHDVVARVRRILKQKRVGHAGTLDPAASGVLTICVGQGTRVAEYLSESGKAYQATICFGVVTDTYDAEGAPIRTASIDGLTRVQIEEALPSFLGEQLQIPPHYSAIKIQGQPAYKRTRAGEEFELEARPIVIYQLTLMAWEPPNLTLSIECSKGTYIRSLAYDLGEKIGCGAYLAALIRTRSGPFRLEESITVEQLEAALGNEERKKFLFPADIALNQYPALYLDAPTTERVLHGNSFSWPLAHFAEDQLPPFSLARVYDTNGTFLAIAVWDTSEECWHPKKVFVTEQD